MLALLSLPSPMHPAVVHFPIVLLLLGSVAAVAAAFTQRWHLPRIAAALFVLGAIGSAVAVQTGEREGELVGEAAPIEAVLDRHEEWAGRTQMAAIAAALLAVAAVVATRWPLAVRGFGIASGVGALLVAWCVIQTGHYGGQLVYRHGAGVNAASADSAPGDASALAAAGRKENHGTRDDD